MPYVSTLLKSLGLGGSMAAESRLTEILDRDQAAEEEKQEPSSAEPELLGQGNAEQQYSGPS